MKSESRPSRPAPAPDLAQQISNILAEPHTEDWVVQEAGAIEEALLFKRAWLHALGLRPRDNLSIESHRRVIAFDRAVDAHFLGADREAVEQVIERPQRKGSAA